MTPKEGNTTSPTPLLFDSSSAELLTHRLFRYPAKFHPPVARTLIERYSRPGELVLDPFVGSGTTLVEASVLGRYSVGSDIDPLAIAVSAAKTTRLEVSELAAATKVLAECLDRLDRGVAAYRDLSVSDISSEKMDEELAGLWFPAIPRLTHWFRRYVIVDLARMLAAIDELDVSADVRHFLRVVFASIIRNASNADPVPVSGLEVTAHMKRLDDAGRIVNPFARALGFVAKQIGNADRADGLARFSDYPNGERKITLEAKSSDGVPELSALDFAGLVEHMKSESADGCLLIAPGYPGGTKGENAQAARRAMTGEVSCWTIDGLARVVKSLESRDITARDVLDVVLNQFAPEDVARAIDQLLENPQNAPRQLAVAMLAALRNIEKYAPADATRSLDMLLPELGRAGFRPTQSEAQNALRQLVSASGGALTILGENRILLNTSIEELERRTAGWAANGSSTRRGSTFHDDPEHRAKPEI